MKKWKSLQKKNKLRCEKYENSVISSRLLSFFLQSMNSKLYNDEKADMCDTASLF